MRYKYLVIGDEDTVLGFRCAGVPGAAVKNSAEAARALAAAREKGVGIVLLTQEVARMIRAEVDALRFGEDLPMVVEIPGPQGPLSERRTLVEIACGAVGVKV